MIKQLLKEALKLKHILTEIDWGKEFHDVKKVCPDIKEVANYLNRVRANANKGYKDREKFSAGMPFIHSKSSFFKSSDGEVDINFFIKQITQQPKNIVNTNEKILKTGGPNDFVYKTGIPAFRGIAYDIQNQKFIYVNTCPGAGACRAICYALKGNYILYPASYDSMTRRLNYLLNYPEKYEQQMYDELKDKCILHKAFSGYKTRVLLRWNDSGDFFAKRYVQIADSVIKRLQKDGYNIESYLYTKVADVAKTADFGVTNFSAGGNKQQSNMVDPKKQKMSLIVPTELFKGLDLMKISDEATLKDRVAKHFNLNKATILNYDELMRTPESNVKKWNVIITPNDGDDAAMRKDVRNVLLTQH
jgi:hypothetical protein